MKVALLAARSLAWAQGQSPSEIARPASVEGGTWRRFSRLARLSAAVLAPLLDEAVAWDGANGDRRRAPLDLQEIPLFFGTGLGEFSSTFQFLRSLTLRGAAGASPLAFQNSVHNAAAGHLSIAFGLRGPSETLCAGDLTTLRTFERAMAWMIASQAPALVVLGDDLGDDAVAGWRVAGHDWPLGEGAAAFLMAPLPAAEPPPPASGDRRRPASGPMTVELIDPGTSSPRRLSMRTATDIRRTMDADPFGAFCTVEAQVLAQSVRDRFRLDLGFPTAPGSALLVRLPA